MTTDLVSRFCGDVQAGIKRYAQSQAKEGVHNGSLTGLCVDHDAQVDGKKWCIAVLAVPSGRPTCSGYLPLAYQTVGKGEGWLRHKCRAGLGCNVM